MLRLALIENLRRVGVRIAAEPLDRNRADVWADQMLDVAEHDPKSLILVIADMARSNPPMVSAFVAELARRLQGQSAALALPLTWIEQRLSESGLSIEQLVQSEAQEQAAVQVSIGNTIGSLRFLGSMDWREFVESDERRRADAARGSRRRSTAGWISRRAITTGTRWRRIAKRSAAVGSGRGAGSGTPGAARPPPAPPRPADDDPTAHVGFYLIDSGRAQLERAAAMRSRSAMALRAIRAPLPVAALPRRDRDASPAA